MQAASSLMVPLLQAFLWFDDGLQSFLRTRGWIEVTRSESMIMTNIVVGTTKPSDIARNLGLSRQAVHTTIGQMVAKGILQVENDPADKRSKIVVLSPMGDLMRRDADRAVNALIAELGRRIGGKNVDRLIEVFGHDWGEPLTTWPGVEPAR